MAGELPQKFNKACDEAACNAAQDAADFTRRARNNFNMGDVAGDVGQIETNTGAIRKNELDNIKKRKQRDEQSREVMDAMRRIAEIDRQLAELYKIGEGIQNDIDDTQARIDTLNSALKDINAVQVDDDGNIVDPKIAQALVDYQKRTGKMVDAGDTDALYAALLAQRDHEQDVLGGHHKSKQDNDSKIDGLKRDRGRQVKIIQREHPNANVEELGEVLKKKDDGTSIQAESNDSAKLVKAAVINITANATEEIDENFSYDPFADTLDGDGETFRKSTDLDSNEIMQEANTQVTLDNSFNQDFSIPKI